MSKMNNSDTRRAEILSDIIGTIDDDVIVDLDSLRNKYYENNQNTKQELDKKESPVKAKTTSLADYLIRYSKYAGIVAAVFIIGTVIVINLGKLSKNEEASDKANYFASTNKGNTAQETAACIEADSVVREDYSAQDEAVSNDSSIEVESDKSFGDTVVIENIEYKYISEDETDDFILDFDINDLVLDVESLIYSDEEIAAYMLPEEYKDNIYYENYIIIVFNDSDEIGLYSTLEYYNEIKSLETK